MKKVNIEDPMLNIINMSNIEYFYYYKNENNDKYSPFNGIEK